MKFCVGAIASTMKFYNTNKIENFKWNPNKTITKKNVIDEDILKRIKFNCLKIVDHIEHFNNISYKEKTSILVVRDEQVLCFCTFDFKFQKSEKKKINHQDFLIPNC